MSKMSLKWLEDRIKFYERCLALCEDVAPSGSSTRIMLGCIKELAKDFHKYHGKKLGKDVLADNETDLAGVIPMFQLHEVLHDALGGFIDAIKDELNITDCNKEEDADG